MLPPSTGSSYAENTARPSASSPSLTGTSLYWPATRFGHRDIFERARWRALTSPLCETAVQRCRLSFHDMIAARAAPGRGAKRPVLAPTKPIPAVIAAAANTRCMNAFRQDALLVAAACRRRRLAEVTVSPNCHDVARPFGRCGSKSRLL